MFNEMEIRIANATSRSNGASAKNKDGSIRAIVPKYVAEHINKKDSMLDFGAGKEAVHTKWLKEQGFNVTGYDFGDNLIDGVHDRNALSRQYKVIMCSNVLNVQSSLKMLLETLKQIDNSLEPGGMLVVNYPMAPRKLVLSATEMAMIIQNVFNGVITRVGGNNSAPLWVVCKPYVN
jgi:2-polyprenyl-3-methyl-5-hydroxy-6-metoxy-1,4-benzoquinol methylase